MSWAQGAEAEASFNRCFRLIRKATSTEDKMLHWDGLYEVYGKEYRIDVKAHRSIHRGAAVSPTHTWVELANVRGEKGWLLGDADLIAFQYYDKWILVFREELLSLLLKNLKDKFAKDEYCLYRRKGRQDLVVLVPMNDIIKIRYDHERV